MEVVNENKTEQIFDTPLFVLNFVMLLKNVWILLWINI